MTDLSGEHQRALIEAYDGAETRAQIADRLGVGDRTINRFWKEARKDGRLPDRARLAFGDRGWRGNPSVAMAAEREDDSDFTADDAPIASPWGIAVPAGDPLLAALHRVHPAKEGLLANLAPAAWLTIEGGRNRPMDTAQVKNWLMHGGQSLLPMTPAQLRAMARAEDQHQGVPQC